MIYYEVWDLSTKNLLGTYPTEAEALELIADALATHGPAYVEDLALGWADNQDRTRGAEIASGQALVERAQSRVA